MTRPVVVHVVLSVCDGAEYLREQIESIIAQTHDAWRLWIRDDGSRDGSWDVASTFMADPRVLVFPRDGRRMGVGPSFGWLLERLPAEAEYVFCSDADDIWLPNKIEISLTAMRRSEAEASGPWLVHTDLAVVDRALRPLASSWWQLQALRTEKVSLARLAVSNVVTGPTILMNRALVREVVPIPSEAVHQDWWIALVAAAVGRSVALPERTVLYRRHDTARTGLPRAGPVRGMGELTERVILAPGRTHALRAWIEDTARQAGAFLDRFGKRLASEQSHALEEIAAIGECGLMERKRRLWRYYALPDRGLPRNLGLLLRG